MPHDSSTDDASLAALRQGDAAALNRLVARWERPLLSFAYRYVQNHSDAEDLVAEVFVRLYRQRERLRPDTRLSAWLFTALTNLCHNHHRWKRRHPTVALDAPTDSGHSPPEVASSQPSPDASLVQDEALAAVRTAIAALPHDLKVTLLLHHYDKMSYREIAAITGCSERGVETRLYRARQQLKVTLAPLMQETPSR
ncbi:MAG TPA: sigma-70 family RNA polymerase sigma factor [Candidatus Didemnitutus sp.]|nr:sigma-70 family RNA polymerase sigma factor [Candidatus Didemnitutus sp.]